MRFRVVLGAVLVVVVGTAGTAAWHALVPTAAVRRGPVIVEIPAHAGTLDVATRLATAGVVHSRWSVLALAAVRGKLRSLRAGEYEVPAGASPLTVLRMVETGRVRQHAVLHPEGATVAELARALEAEGLARAADIRRVAADPAFLRAHAIEGPSAEGYLFPDTYYFVKGMRPDEVLGRMVQRLRARLGPDVEARARAHGLTLHRLLTLASIIEREAVDPQEARIISGVFWNRLRRDMPLQADPTVQYAVGKERRTLTRGDLGSDNPYNTYRYAGLPPGPIASPGRRAIEAALDPAPVKYLYFVAIDERRHQFSATVEEHNAAVARYRHARGAAR